MKKTLVIIDLNNFIYRAFFGIQQPLRTPKGELVNAVYGTFNMLHRILTDLKPHSVVAALDSRTSNRREEYSDYKSTRSKMPDDLKHQIGMVHQMLECMGVQMVMEEGLEADDLIYNLCLEANDFDEVYIASSDKDLMQLVNDKVKVYDSMKQKIYDRAGVIEKFGVAPEQVVDFLSLLGDASDSIPGVKGIGEKGAVKLLQEYGSLDNIYARIQEVKPEGIKNKLIAGEADARMSYQLASLRKTKTSLLLNPWVMDKAKITPLLTEWNMKSCLYKLQGM
jgi:DNA polymerase-1